MLTLLTGVPGSGKTAAGVDLVRKLVEGGRPLYVLEIPEDGVERINLKLPHTLLGDEASCHRWHEIVPDGAVVFAPEGQRIWPARAPSARVPLHAEAVGQHRHRGIDMVVDTQGPKLLDDKVRLRVGRHIHLRDLGILGRHWYEWPECGDPGQWRSAPIKVRYRLPRAVFGLYTSATQHIKPVRKIPPQLYVLGLLIPLLLFIVWRMYNSIADKQGPKPSPGATAQAAPSAGGSVGRSVAAPVTAVDMLVAATPRVSDDPRSAPRFDPLRVVARMPRIMGGWCRAGKCVCYIDDALKAPISNDACARWVADPPFDAYHVPSRPSLQDRMPGGRPEGGGNAIAPGAAGATTSDLRSSAAAAVSGGPL